MSELPEGQSCVDRYIASSGGDMDNPRERKLIEDSWGYQRALGADAWRELKRAIAKEWPFSWLLRMLRALCDFYARRFPE